MLQKNSYLSDELECLNTNIKEERQIQDLLNEELPETQKEQIIKARVGQGVFKNNVIALEKECRVTGLDDSRFLIASHIKPWKNSNNQERLDGNNGLLLSPHIDKLFDHGWISFSDDGKVLISPHLNMEVVGKWKLSIKNVGSFSNKQKSYLLYHRENVYKGTSRLL